ASTKLPALVFVTIVLATGLALRELTQRRRKAVLAAAPAGAVPATVPLTAPATPAFSETARSYEGNFLGETMLVAARGWTPALQFALEQIKIRDAQLLVLFIREVNIQIDRKGDWRNDFQARELFSRIMSEAQDGKIKPLYSTSDSPADTIIDIAATFGVDT